MAGCLDLDLRKLMMLLAVIALVVGLIFHVVYLVSNRDEDSNQDLYNREQSKLFFLLAIALGIVSIAWPHLGSKGAMHM